MRDAFADPTPSTRPPPATAGETPGPTSDPATATATSETTAATSETTTGMSETAIETRETATGAEPADVIPAGERPMVTDDLPPVTGNGDTPSA